MKKLLPDVVTLWGSFVVTLALMYLLAWPLIDWINKRGRERRKSLVTSANRWMQGKTVLDVYDLEGKTRILFHDGSLFTIHESGGISWDQKSPPPS